MGVVVLLNACGMAIYMPEKANLANGTHDLSEQ